MMKNQRDRVSIDQPNDTSIRSESVLSFHVILDESKKRRQSNDSQKSFIVELPNPNSSSVVIAAAAAGQEQQHQVFAINPKESITNIISLNTHSSQLQQHQQNGFSPAHPPAFFKGFLYMILSSLCFSASAFLVKKVETTSISVLELMFYRSLLIMIMLFILHRFESHASDSSLNNLEEGNENSNANGELILQNLKTSLRESTIQYLIPPVEVKQQQRNITFLEVSERKFVQIYAILHSIIVFSYFYGLQELQLFEAISLQNCSLLFTVVFTVFCVTSTNRHVRLEVSAALIVLGIYLMSAGAPIKPTLTCILGGSFVQALVQQIVNKYASDTPLMTLLFYTSFVQLILSPILIAIFAQFHMLTMQDVICIAAMAFFQICATQYLQKSFTAFEAIHANYANLHFVVSILITLGIGKYFLHDTVSTRHLLGTLFIAASSLMIILKKNL